jgi:hypothetical protein
MRASGFCADVVANEMGVPTQTVRDWCAGCKRIGAFHLMASSRLLGVPIRWFFADLGQPAPGRQSASGTADTFGAGIRLSCQVIDFPRGRLRR